MNTQALLGTWAKLFLVSWGEVVSLERTDEFVQIDTEAVAESDKEKARAWSNDYSLDFIFLTDGDDDRPLSLTKLLSGYAAIFLGYYAQNH